MARKIQGSLDIAQINGEDLASAAIPVTMAAVPTGGSTEAKQDTIITALNTLAGHVDGLEGFTDGIEGFVDGLEGLATTLNGLVDGLEGVDYATQTTLAAVLAKIIAAPATEAKQDTLNGYVDGIEAKLDTLIGHVDAVETKQDTANTALASLVTALTSTVTGFIATSQATINDTVVKASAGTLISVNASNTHSSNWVYLKFYNKATAPDPSGGVDYPVTTLVIPPASKVHLQIPTNGIPFSNGISYVIVGGYADNDETAVALGQVQISGTYL